MRDQNRRLSTLTSHWPELSERERLGLVVALGLDGVLTMGLELVAITASVRAGRRCWRAQGTGAAAAGRVAALRSAGGLAVLSLAQKVASRLVFTSLERHLSHREAA